MDNKELGCLWYIAAVLIGPLILLPFAIWDITHDPAPAKGPREIPDQTSMERIWALQAAPVGSYVTYGPERETRIICSKRGDGERRVLLDIRENIAACNINSEKEERTAWGWVIDPRDGWLPSISGIALPCENPLRETVANDELREHLPECS